MHSQTPPFDHLLAEVCDPSVRRAFMAVDRVAFVPPALRAEAWRDTALPVDHNATISQPSLVARTTEWLALEPHHRVLEVGTGTGYQTAILAELAAEVFTIEVNVALARAARERLQSLGYRSVQLRAGDGSDGWAEAAPFDRILSTAAFDDAPTGLIRQLKPGGICIAPIGREHQTQQLTAYTMRADGTTDRELLCAVRFVQIYH